MKAKYCPLCERMVKPRKKINWFFIFFSCFLCFAAIGAILLICYIPYYIFKNPECPICGSTVLLNSKEQKANGIINDAVTAIKKLVQK